MAMDEALRSRDPLERKQWLTVVIAGGDPTGVEIAGMLAEMRKNILEKEYRILRAEHLRIVLVDGAPTLLGPMSASSQNYSRKTLEKMGVEVKLGKLVKDYQNDVVSFSDGETIESRLLFWTAGVTSRVFEGIPEDCYGRGRRLKVNRFQQVEGIENVYAIGDTAIIS